VTSAAPAAGTSGTPPRRRGWGRLPRIRPFRSWTLRSRVVLVVVAMLADLARDDAGLRDVANIAAIAAIGRALVYTSIIQLATQMSRWSTLNQNLIVGCAAIASLGLAHDVRRDFLPAGVPEFAGRVSSPSPVSAS